MKTKRFLAGMVATGFVVSALPGAVLAESKKMTVDVDSILKDSTVYGISTDYSVKNSVYKDGAVNPAFVNAFSEFQMPLVRVGEGITSKFEWKDAVGPEEGRSEQSLWGETGKIMAGPLEIIEAYETINPDAEFTITLNMLTDDAEDAADFAEFLTGDASTEWGAKRIEYGHPKPVNVKLYELGNELDNQISIDEYISKSKEFIAAVEAIDEDAKFAVNADTGIYNAVKRNETDYADWHNAILADDALADGIDYIALHMYNDYTNNGVIDKIIDAVEEDIKDAGKEGQIKIYVSEQAGYYIADDSANPNPHNMKGVLETANIYSRLMKRDVVDMVTYHGLSSSEWKHVVYDSSKNEMYLNAIGHLSKLFAEYGNGKVLSTEFDGFTKGVNSTASGIAVKADNGNINLIFANKSGSELPVDISFSDGETYKIVRETKIVPAGKTPLEADITAAADQITADTYNYATKSAISTYTVPAYSVCAVSLEKSENKLSVLNSYDFADLSKVSAVSGDYGQLSIDNGKLFVKTFEEDEQTYTPQYFHLTEKNTASSFVMTADMNVLSIGDEAASTLDLLLNTAVSGDVYSEDNLISLPLETGEMKLKVAVDESGSIKTYVNNALISTEEGGLKNAEGYIGFSITDVNFTLDNVVISEFGKTVAYEEAFTYEENFDNTKPGTIPEGWEVMSSKISAGVENGELTVKSRDWDYVKGIQLTNLGTVKREGLVIEAALTLVGEISGTSSRKQAGFMYMGDGSKTATAGMLTYAKNFDVSEPGKTAVSGGCTEVEKFLNGEKVNFKLVFSSANKSPDIYVNGAKFAYNVFNDTTQNSGFLGLMVRSCTVKYDNIKISGIKTTEYAEAHMVEKVIDFTYEENFDSYANGTLPPQWFVTNPSKVTASVTDGKLVLNSTEWRTEALLFGNLPDVQRDGLTMEADMKLISYDTGAQANYGQRTQTGFAYMSDGTSISSTGLLTWFPQAEMREQGVSSRPTVSTGNVYGAGEGFINKENVKLKIVFTSATKSPEVYVNGTHLGKYSNVTGTTVNSGYIGLMAYVAKAEFDNIKVTGKRKVCIPDVKTYDAYFAEGAEKYLDADAAIADVKVVEKDVLGTETDITADAEITATVNKSDCEITVTYNGKVIKTLTCQVEYSDVPMVEALVDFTYEENFDSFANGEMPEGWFVTNPSKVTASVSNGKFVVKATEWGDEAVLFGNLPDVQREGLTMEADMKLTWYDTGAQANYGQRTQTGFAYMSDGSVMSSTGLLTWYPQAEMREQGVSSRPTVSTGNVYGAGEGFINKENVKLKIVFTSGTKSPEVYINDTYLGSYSNVTGTTVNSGYVGFLAYVAQAEFDNLKITGKRKMLVPDVKTYDAYFADAEAKYASAEEAVANVKVVEKDVHGNETDITAMAEITSEVNEADCVITVSYNGNVVKTLNCTLELYAVEGFIYEENFDNYANGEMPEGWFVTNPSKVTASVSNGKFVVKATEWGDEAVLFGNLPDVQREGLTMEADMKLTWYDTGAQANYGQRTQMGFAYMSDGSVMSSAGLLTWYPQAEMREQGISSKPTVSTGNVYGAGEGFINKENVKLKIVFTSATKSPEVYINGTHLGSYSNVYGTTVNSGYVGFLAYAAQAEFDNLKITGKRLKFKNKENSISVKSFSAVSGKPVVSAEIKCADEQIANAMVVAAVYDKATKALVAMKSLDFDGQNVKTIKTDFVMDEITDYSDNKYEIKIMAFDKGTLKPFTAAAGV